MGLKSDNEGAKRLRETGATSAEVAKVIGCGLTTAMHWRNARKTPNKQSRSALQLKYKIPVGSWDLAPMTGAAKPVIKPSKNDPSLGTGPTAGRDAAAAYLRRIQEYRRSLEANNASDASLLKAHALERQAISAFAKANGELGAAPDTGKVLLSPQWVDIRTAIVRAVAKYPDAARAVVEALRALRAL
jgi:hypothetical protein